MGTKRKRFSSNIESWKIRFEKARKLPPKIVLTILLRKLLHIIDDASTRIENLSANYPSSRQLEKSLRLSEPLQIFMERKFKSYPGFILSDDSQNAIVALLKAHHEDWVCSAVKRAEDVCHHKFGVLGKEIDFGKQINWHKDYVSGHEWPLVYYKKIKRINLEDNSDIKYPWELSRFHQGIFLGKAYALTKEEKYSKEFFSQFQQWVLKTLHIMALTGPAQWKLPYVRST